MSKNQPEPHLFIVFGGTGDLMERKLLPALYLLKQQGHLDEDNCRILSVARDTSLDDDGFRSWARKALDEHGEGAESGSWCDKCLHYQTIGRAGPEEYRALKERVEALERKHDLPGNRILYLALPPSAFSPTIRSLGENGFHQGSGWSRLVVEKPFGRDLDSARELNHLIHEYFSESQIFRIDHYLGKETVQNLLVFRFANPLFESSWNRDRVESVEITVAEELGVGDRADYYDRAGALRDMVQNHLTQLLALTAMEVPAAFEADSIRNEKVKVLRSIEPPRPEEAVFGRYAAGTINGEEVRAYRDEEGVDTYRNTETFAALLYRIENWRWQGVPFYVRTGKRLPRRTTQIAVKFRRAPVAVFQPHQDCRVHSNALVLTLQPDEGFDLLFEVKTPDQGIAMKTQSLRFRYADAFAALPEAYETLLLDVLTGDQTLFVRADEVEESWRLHTPLLEEEIPLYEYPAGRWGPEEVEGLKGTDWLIL